MSFTAYFSPLNLLTHNYEKQSIRYVHKHTNPFSTLCLITLALVANSTGFVAF